MTAAPKSATAGAPISGRPRPERPAGYWERIDAIVATAPPLTDDQKAVIRAAIHGPRATARTEAA